MNTEDKLPHELLWEADGHLTDVALTMLADGEAALLDDEAEPHVARCDACSARLGAAAMMSLRVGEELPALAARAPVPSPLVALSPSINASAQAANELAPALAPVRQSSSSVMVGVRALPLRAIAAALAIAAIGAMPSLIAGTQKLPELIMTAMRALALIGRTVVGVAQGTASDALLVAPALSWLSAALLVLSGLAVARVMSRRRVLQEGGM